LEEQESVSGGEGNDSLSPAGQGGGGGKTSDGEDKFFHSAVGFNALRTDFVLGEFLDVLKMLLPEESCDFSFLNSILIVANALGA
jgi:hypothetical protein